MKAGSLCEGHGQRMGNMAPPQRGSVPFGKKSGGNAQPEDAALGIQARHLQWFHVKHLHVGRQRGDFIVGVLALHGQPGAALRQRLARPAGEVHQRGKGAAADQRIARGQLLHTAVDAAQVGQAQRGRRLLDEGGLLAHRVHAVHVDLRAADGKDQRSVIYAAVLYCFCPILFL